MQKQTLATVASAAATGDEPGILITTSALDRQSDELVPEGCDYAAYLKNPVVLFAHQHAALPVGMTTHLAVTPGRAIEARWQWLENDEFASRVKNAFEQGVLRGASVGFVPRESEQNRHGGRKYLKWELVEWSLCAVPANPEAVRTLKALDLWQPGTDEVVLEVDDETTSALDVSGFTADDLTHLATASAARRHRRTHADPYEPVGDLRPEEIREAMASTLPTLIRSVVEREVRAAFARARGRVD